MKRLDRKFLAAALGIGLLVGFAVGRSTMTRSLFHRSSDASSATADAAARQSKRLAALRANRAAMRLGDEIPARITLGDITTVPFQELYGVLSTLPKEKLKELAEQLRQLPDELETRNKITAFYKAWAHFDAPTALQTASKLSTTEEKGTAARAVIDSADAAVVAGLAKQISDWPPDAVSPAQRNALLASATAKWAQASPVDAAKFLDSLNTADVHFMNAFQQIGLNWGAADPAAAMAWAKSHAGPSFVSSVAVNGALLGWWQKDRTGAENYAISNVSNIADRQLAFSLATNIWSTDPQRAIDFVNRLPDVEARTQADSMLAIQMGMNDPQAASSWAANLPNDVRSSVLRSAVSHWASTDLAGPAAWLNTLTGPPRDEAIDAYSSFVARSDPSAAVTWATSIADQQTRAQALDRVATIWLSSDSKAASSWIQSSSLTVGEKQRLLALRPGG